MEKKKKKIEMKTEMKRVWALQRGQEDVTYSIGSTDLHKSTHPIQKNIFNRDTAQDPHHSPAKRTKRRETCIKTKHDPRTRVEAVHTHTQRMNGPCQ